MENGTAPGARGSPAGERRGRSDEQRSGVMVNLLLDRSGSMKGAPLGAVEAAQQIVELAPATISWGCCCSTVSLSNASGCGDG